MYNQEELRGMESVIDNIDGGLAIYKIINRGRIIPVYVSNKIDDVLYVTKDEFLKMSGEDIFALVYNQDKDRIYEAVVDAALNDRSSSISFRIIRKEDGYVWVNGVFSSYGTEDGHTLILAIYTKVSQQFDLYTHALRHTSLGIHIVDEKTYELYYCNEAAFAIVNKDICEYGGRRCYEVLFGRSTPCSHCMIGRCGSNNMRRETLVPDIGKVISSICERTTWNGRPVMVEYLHDVTQLKEKEDRINSSTAKADDKKLMGYYIANLRQNSIIEQKTIGSEISIKTRTDRYDKAVELWKNTISDSADRENYSRVHHSSRLMAYYNAGGTSESLEYQIRLADNSHIWVNSIIELISDHSTGDLCIYEYIYNIHRKKLTDEIMSAAVDYDSERFGSIELDNNQITILHNRNEANAHEITVENYTKDYSDYAELKVYPEDRDLFMTLSSITNLDTQLKYNDVYEFTHRELADDGTMHVKNNHYAMYDRDNRICLMSRSDVTDIIAEEELKQQQLEIALEMAQKATKAKPFFLSNMSHEIRTPMNAIIGLTKLAQESEDINEIKEYIRKIDSSSDYLLGMLSDILDMSRIENGKFLLNKKWVSVYDLLDSCISIIEPQMKKKGIRFIYPSSGINDDLEFYVDELRTRQMLINLLNNAYKFTPEGGTVILKMTNVSKSDIRAVDKIIISDTGCGMSRQFMEKLFTPFEQEHNPYSDTTAGTGLGLALVKEIVAAMGGDISVESQLGAGTTFTINYPYEYRRKSDNRLISNPKSVIDEVILTDRRILLVDDQKLNREIGRKLLENKGMIVHEAVNGKEAVRLFSSSEVGYYSAIVMDIRMPVMDGLSATKIIRSIGREDAATIPIIAMTANAFGEDVIKSQEAGIDMHLAKPINPDLLIGAISSLIKD